MTRQIPVGRISRLWLQSVHHPGPHDVNPVGVTTRGVGVGV